MTRSVFCNNWDGDKPEYLTDVRTGQTLGRLMPRIDQATLEASAGIQPWSHPRGKVALQMYDPDSVVQFAEHWERVNGKTYPFSSE